MCACECSGPCHLCDADCGCVDCCYNCGYCAETICEDCQVGCDRCGSNFCDDCMPTDDDMADINKDADDVDRVCWDCLLLWYQRGNNTSAEVLAAWEAQSAGLSVEEQVHLIRRLRAEASQVK